MGELPKGAVVVTLENLDSVCETTPVNKELLKDMLNQGKTVILAPQIRDQSNHGSAWAYSSMPAMEKVKSQSPDYKEKNPYGANRKARRAKKAEDRKLKRLQAKLPSFKK